MRATTTLLLLALGALPARGDIIYLTRGEKRDVKVLEHDDEKVVYLDRRMRRIRLPGDIVRRVVKKRSTIHEYEDRLAAAKTADAVAELVAWAKEKRFHRDVIRSLWERTLELDADHAAANEALGRVRFDGEWMTPRERDERKAEKEAAEKRAKGLVRYKDRWVTPEEKENLEKGLVLHEGRWMTPEEAKRAQGLVLHEGKWVPKADLEILKLRSRAGKATGLRDRIRLEQTKSYAVLGDLPPEQLRELAETMERLHAEWRRVFPQAREQDLLEGKHRLYVFRRDPPYKRLVKFLYREREESGRHSEAWLRHEKLRMEARLKQTSFWMVHPEIMSGHVQMPDPFEDLRAHCVHFGANVLATRQDHSGRFLTWWLMEGIAYYFEKRVTGRIETFNTDVGPGPGYADAGPVEHGKANPWLDSTKWPRLLLTLVQTGRDPRLETIKGKDLFSAKNRLDARDVAKAWSVVTFLVQDDREKLARFVADAKVMGGSTPVERETVAMIKHYGGYPKVDERWRAYARNNFRLVR